MDAREVERKLRIVESAAASAVLNGADPDDVRRRIEVGIADALNLNARRPSASAVARPEPTEHPSALSDWAARVDAR